jgi:hypothetical protein
VALALVYQLSCASGPAQRNGGNSPEVASLQAQPLRVLSQVDDDRRAAAGGPAGNGSAEEEGVEKSEKENEKKSKGLAQWRALRNAAAPSQRSSHSSHAAAASQQGTECELEDGEGSRKGASTRLKEWRSQRRGGEHREEGPNKHNQEGSKEADNAHLPLGETIAILLVGWTRLVTSAVSLGTLQEHVCSPVCML